MTASPWLGHTAVIAAGVMDLLDSPSPTSRRPPSAPAADGDDPVGGLRSGGFEDGEGGDVVVEVVAAVFEQGALKAVQDLLG
ncbi:hypothetical protein [Actinacidiphila soli]|uniref:hypothetical protein n=1 Tax=Actinacidiphila soli TaxID=2487275 RepID=UPI0013E2CFD7|nr:hypothetical protein [Actinacidiphila soli]